MRARFVAAMVRRELRAAGRRFGLYGSCMAIGIAVVVGLHSLREAVDDAVDLRSKELLGADLRLESREPLPTSVLDMLKEIESRALAPPTEVTRLGSMALAERSGRSRLVDLLAIDGTYPLYGEVWTEPAYRWKDFGRVPGQVYVDSSLMLQLDLKVGDRLRIGGQSFEIAAAVKKAPGSFGLQVEVAPRVFLRKSDLDRTDLIQEGSLVSYLLYLKLPDNGSGKLVEPWLAKHAHALEALRVRTQTLAGYQQDMSDAFGNLTRYLGLVGLAALVLGSIGVAAGVRVFIREKLDSVALLRSIGASPSDVVAIYTGLAIGLGLAAGVLGLLLCLPLLWILPSLLGDLLPVEVNVHIGPAGIATGLGLSVWATLLCAMGPVIDLANISPLRALRRDFGDAGATGASGGRARGISGRMASICAIAASLVLASIWQSGSLRVGLWFAAGLAGTVGVLAGAATLLIWLLRRHPPRAFAYWARQGIANLFRPRNHTLPTTIAIGFALFVVATVQLVEKTVVDQMAIDSDPERPNFVLFDVQSDQLEGVGELLAEHGARIVDRAPLVSARLAAVDGIARADWLASDAKDANDAKEAKQAIDRDLRWALQREYRLTYADTLRDSEQIVAGRFWKPGEIKADQDPMPVSLERDLAKTLGVGIGDRLRWQIQGVEVETVVTSLRKVDWGRMATNFFVVFPPAGLEAAPQSTVLLAHLGDEAARAAMQRDLVGRYPNVSALDATLILRSLDAMLGQIGIAIRLLSIFTLATGLAILVAAAMAARSERTHEALLLRVLGASRRVLRRIVATEALVLAALAATVGGLLSLVAAWAVVVFVFDMPFDPPLLQLAGLVAATFCVTALFGALGGVGGLGGRRGTSASPQAALRRDAM